MKKTLPDILVGVLLAFFVFVLYLATLSRGAAPGTSASLILGVLDLFPRLEPQAPYWHFVAKMLAAVGGRQSVGLLNGFSALCGAVSVGLLYAVMRQGAILFLDPYLYSEKRARIAGVLAGFVAAACLGLSAPFWSVSTRAHMMTFDVMLLLLAGWLLVSFVRTGAIVYAVVLACCYGFFAAEFATMLVISPMFAIGVLYGLWRHEMLLPRKLGLIAALVVVSVVLAYLISAFSFYATPGYALRDYSSFWSLLWSIWLGQARMISRSLPREGWLIILFTTTVPWLAMFAIAKRGLNDDRDKALVFLHLVMTAFAGALWIHIPLTPWRLLAWQRLLITPYVLVAMVSGYLIAFWFLFAGQWGQAREHGWVELLRFTSGYVLSVVVLVFALVVPWWFVDEVHAKGSEAAEVIAEKVVDSLDGRGWLISNGLLDYHCYLAAWRAGVPLQIISLPSAQVSVYLRYVQSLFDEVRYQNAAQLSLQSLLQEWLRDPAAAQDVAVLDEPDVWRTLGLIPVPNKMVYVGVAPDALAFDDSDVGKSLSFLSSFSEVLDGLETRDAVAEQIVNWGKTHAGRLGNDFGVLLEDAGRNTDARKVYDGVRELDPDNISVLLNLVSMVSDGRTEDADGALQSEMDTLAESLSERLQIWSLARTYGIVRAPEGFAQMGWSWAYSGQARMAVEQVERAVSLQGDTRSPALEALMAEVYLLDNRPLESATIYRGMLDKPSQRQMGLAGLYRLALRSGRTSVARNILAQLAEGGMPADRVVLEEVMLDLLDNRAEAALARLQDFMLDRRDLLRGWVLMAEAGFALDDESTLRRALRRIEMLEGARGYYTSMIRGRLAFRANDFATAAELYETALQHRPRSVSLMEDLLRLHLVLRNRSAAQKQMKALLHVNPEHTMALYVRGSLQIADGDYRLAENSLRRSLASERTPMALNDLAWLLLRKGEYEEAESLAREGLAAHETQAAMWDTLGVVLMRTDRLEDAEEALSRSIALDGSQPVVHLHLALLQLLRGREEAAREIISQFEEHVDRLDDASLEIWAEIQDRL